MMNPQLNKPLLFQSPCSMSCLVTFVSANNFLSNLNLSAHYNQLLASTSPNVKIWEA